jgi:ribosomal protein S7
MSITSSPIKINLYNKLLGSLIKKGNKIKAKSILDSAFYELSNTTGYSINLLLIKLFVKLNTFVETKTVRIRRRRHLVPFSIGLKRRSYLITKWLMEAVKENHQKIPVSKKIVAEILLILKNGQSKALKLKMLNDAQALANRSNLHFRW